MENPTKYLMWHSHRLNLISEEIWFAMERDIQDFFTIKSVKSYWESVKTFHTPGFVQFVTRLSERQS